MRLLLATLGVALLAASTATAGPERVAEAQRIAEQQWGVPCGGAEVTVTRGNVRGANASWQHPFHAPDDTRSYYNCTITFRRGHIPWGEFCTVFNHEWLHLMAWRAKSGKEYIGQRKDGTRYADRLHSRNPRSVMFPRFVRVHHSCKGPAPIRRRPIAASAHAPPVTVFLAHGGGWTTGHPDNVESRARDLRAHGINARSIQYPLGQGVLAAIEHVKALAHANPGLEVCYGISAGGTICAALAASGDAAGAINVVGPLDFPTWNTPSGLERKHTLRMTRAEQVAASPTRRLKGRQSPSLHQCGAADPLVPCDQALAFGHRAKRAQPDTTVTIMSSAHNQFRAYHLQARRWIQRRWGR